MAPNIRSHQLETRTQRLKLIPRRKPYSIRIAPGIRLGYRRNEGAGTWSVIGADGAGGSWLKRIAVADDHEDTNGKTVLNFWQATETARELARSADGVSDTERPLTVKEALEVYQRDLKARGGNETNATLILPKVRPALAAKPVSALTARDVLGFRDSLVASGIKKSAVNRYMTSFRAALHLAARLDRRRITNGAEWKLEPLPDDGTARNVILSDDEVRAIVVAAYELDRAFGLLIETLAVTGARISQVQRLNVEDLLADRLLVPASRKGRRKKSTEKRPILIPTSLAAKLFAAAAGRRGNAPLLVNGDGQPWRRNCQVKWFPRIAKAAGFDPAEVVLYSLRHSSIVRQLLGAVPVRIVAVGHDTSVAMIERTYSRYILDHSDALVRRALLDIDATPAAGNVVRINR